MLNLLCLLLHEFVIQVHHSNWDQTYNKICIQCVTVSPQMAGKWFFSVWHLLSENPVSPHVKLTTSAITTFTTRSSQCNGLSASHWNKKQLVKFSFSQILFHNILLRRRLLSTTPTYCTGLLTHHSPGVASLTVWINFVPLGRNYSWHFKLLRFRKHFAVFLSKYSFFIPSWLYFSHFLLSLSSFSGFFHTLINLVDLPSNIGSKFYKATQIPPRIYTGSVWYNMALQSHQFLGRDYKE